jgi:hypothetical protein
MRKFFEAIGRPAPEFKIVYVKPPRLWPHQQAVIDAMGYGASKHKAADLAFPNRPLYPRQLAVWDCKNFIIDIDRNAGKTHVFNISIADIDREIAERINQKEQAVQQIVEFIIPFKRFDFGNGSGWSTKTKAVLDALKGIGVDVDELVRRSRSNRTGSTKIRCRSDQFAQFLIQRNAFGGENWFAELDAKFESNTQSMQHGQWFVDVSELAVHNGGFNEAEALAQAKRVCEKQDAAHADIGNQFVDINGDRWSFAKYEGRVVDATYIYRNGHDITSFSNEALWEVLKSLASHGSAAVRCEEADQIVRDRTLEEVATAFDSKAKRVLRRPNSGIYPAKLAEKDAERYKAFAEYVRKMKGGVSFKDIDRQRAIAFYGAHNSQFMIQVSPAVAGPDGASLSGRLPACILPGSDAKVVKIVGHNVYLGVEDPRLDWTTADRIPFKKAKG